MMNDTCGKWLSILDYAHQTQLSISTIRRHIKNKKIEARTIEGKYYLWFNQPAATVSNVPAAPAAPTAPTVLTMVNEEKVVEQLNKEIKKYQQEIAELKMLISIYESSIMYKIEDERTDNIFSTKVDINN